MPDIVPPIWAAEPPASGRTFFGGLTLKEFKALSHREQMQAIAKYDKQRGMKATYHKDPDSGMIWKVLKPTKKPRKK